MILGKRFKVEKTTDTVVEKAGEEESQRKRAVVLNAEGMTMTLTGTPDELGGFVSGEEVRVDVRREWEASNSDK